MWTYVLVLDAGELTVPSWGFGAKTFRLNELVSVEVEDDGAYALTLFFDGGQKVEILKYVAGRGELMSDLNAHSNA